MILTCEKCQTRYLVKPASISAKGQIVKCAKCSHSWFQAPEGSPPPDVQQEPPEKIAPIPKGSALPVIQPKPSAPHWLKVAAMCTFLITLGSIPVFYYDNALKLVPQIEAVYETLGVPSTQGLGFENLALQEAGGNTYLLKGTLINASKTSRTMPNLRIKVLDKQNKVLHTIMLKSSGETLTAGESFDFSNKLAALPETAKKLDVDIGNNLELLLR